MWFWSFTASILQSWYVIYKWNLIYNHFQKRNENTTIKLTTVSLLQMRYHSWFGSQHWTAISTSPYLRTVLIYLQIIQVVVYPVVHVR